MKKNLILLLLVTVALVMGCTTGTVTVDPEMQNKILTANSNLQTYTADMHMEMSMEAKGEGFSTVVDAQVSMDRPNKKMSMKGTSQIGEMQLPVETYIVDGFMYSNSANIWTKSAFDTTDWNQQDIAQQTITFLKRGELTNLPDQSVNGKSHWVFEIEPDWESIMEYAGAQQEQEIDQEEFRDIIKEYKVTVWVDKETYTITKSKIDMTMEVPGDSGTSSIDMHTETTLRDINNPVSITLPAEAENSKSFDDMFDDFEGFEGDDFEGFDFN